jgi:hypothetical protein
MEVSFGERKEEIQIPRGRESGETESFASANVLKSVRCVKIEI